jgi:hypothetical protein
LLHAIYHIIRLDPAAVGRLFTPPGHAGNGPRGQPSTGGQMTDRGPELKCPSRTGLFGPHFKLDRPPVKLHGANFWQFFSIAQVIIHNNLDGGFCIRFHDIEPLRV